MASLVAEARDIFRHPNTTLDIGEIWFFFAGICYPPGKERPLLAEYHMVGSTRAPEVRDDKCNAHHSPGAWDGYTLAVCSDGGHTVPVSFTSLPSRSDAPAAAFAVPDDVLPQQVTFPTCVLPGVLHGIASGL